MSKLSDKHERFCQEYISNGCNATKAYMAVYGVPYSQAEKNASKVMGYNGVKERLDELKKETQQYYQITKEELLNDLKDILKSNKGVRDSVAMKAIEIINKMSGFDAPLRQDITISEQPLFTDEPEE